jgi:hypothetical protein
MPEWPSRGRPEAPPARAQSLLRLWPPRSEHARRGDGGKRFSTDCVELRILDLGQLNTEPAQLTDVRRPEEAFRIRIDEIRLDTVRSGAPDRQPAVAVVVVEEHYEALLAPDEERGSTVALTFRRLWQG